MGIFDGKAGREMECCVGDGSAVAGMRNFVVHGPRRMPELDLSGVGFNERPGQIMEID